MTPAVPPSIRRAWHQRRLRLSADFPDRVIVSAARRFIPAPQRALDGRHRCKRPTVWVSSYEDNGQRIILHPYRELYDDPANGIRELSDWYLLFGCVRKSAKRDQSKRWWLQKPEEKLSPEEEARKRRELAKKLFPLVKKPVRKMLFSEEVQKELTQTFDCMTQTAIREGRIQDCKADRDDYQRTLQYVCWSLASKYDENRPGNEGRSPASLVTFIKGSLGTKVLDMKRSRYALKRLGDVFTVSIHAEASTGESDSEEYIMHLDELAEDGRQSIRECDENMDIQSLRAYLASPKGKAYEKAFNLLFLDGLSIEDAAKEMGISYSAFKFNMLRPLRGICRHFGFAPKSKQCKTE